MSKGIMQSWTIWLVLCALAASSAVGCARTPLVQRPWVAVSTANFRVMSSLDEQRTVKLARELESFRAAVTQILGIPLAEHDIPARVYVFDDQEEWDQIAPAANLDGYFFQNWRYAVMAINAAGNQANSQRTIQHEYVHKILRLSGAMYPLWYNEGLAEFLATATVADDTVKLGMPPPRYGLLKIAQPDRFAPRASSGSHIVRDDGDDAVAAGDVFYARAWARVDYLHLAHVASSDEIDHRDRLHLFLRLLNQGRAHDEAFAEAFGMSIAEFDDRVDAYLRQDKLPLVTIRVDAPSGAQKARVRPMRPVEVASALGELAWRTGKLERARALLERSLAMRSAVPDEQRARASAGASSREGGARTLSALAWVHGLQDHHDEARRLFESAIELAPKDPIPRLDYAGYLLAVADGAPPAKVAQAIGDARVHLGAALELEPDLAETHALLGMTYVLDEGNAPHAGIRALVRAAELLPRDGKIYYFLAHLLIRAGEVDQARRFLQVVLGSAHAGDLADKARELLRMLGQGNS